MENKITSFQFYQILEKKLALSQEFSDTVRFDVIHEKVSKFTDFLLNLKLSCKVCNRNRNDDPDRFPGDIGQNEFRNEVEKSFFEFPKFMKK
jgi:hypothetical protein